jgi:GAF domain-containing protein
MKRRGGASGQRAKASRSVALKRRPARKPAGRRKPPETDLQSQLQDCTRELNAAHDQLTAMSEVLSVISGSAGDLKPVFDVLLANAVRICGARFGNLSLVEGDGMRMVAMHNASPEFEKLRRREPIIPLERSPLGALFQTKKIVHIGDLAADKAYANAGLVKVAGARAALCVPMLRGDDLIGALVLYRMEPLPFTDKQVELLTNFATQAVIAIENARLLSELQGSLARQTATSEILRVISRSPTDVRPVFDSIVLTAVRLLRCDLVFVLLCDGATFSPAAVASPEGPLADVGPTNLPIDRNANFPSRAILDKNMLHLPDWSLIDLPEHERIIHNKFGVNSALYLPLLREGECIGLLTLVGKRPNSFGPSEIAQAESFRDQALIAIENTRLFNETKEALEQQTATSEVLQVISSSPGDLQPVFDTMLENAVRICDATFGNIYRWDGELLQLLAAHNTPPALAAARKRSSLRPTGTIGRMVATKTASHVADLAAHETYTEERDPGAVSAVELGGVRTVLAVPMLKENELIGSFTLYRQEVRPFTDKQTALVTSFANQAVIAIENTRLLTELRQRTTDLTESLEQQTATSEILASISGSLTDSKPVFDAIVRDLLRLFGTRYAVVGLLQDGMIHMGALDGDPGFERLADRYPVPVDDNTVIGRAIRSKQVVQQTPVIDNPAAPGASARLAREFGYNSMLAAPMLRGDKVIGAIVTAHREPKAFDDKQVALVKAFADQAVIAIENVRLFNELRQRTDDLTESLEQQTATSEVLQVISSSPGDPQPVFEAMLENAVRICNAKFGNIYGWDGELLHLVAAHNTPPALADARRHQPIRPSSIMRHFVETKTAIHILDSATHEAYAAERDPTAVAAVELGGVRTFLTVPMLKENELVGSFSLYRQEVRPFTDKQIALVTSFAAQAVIAIENTRLLSELRQSLEQQTATADVLRVISSSPGDLQPVFAAVLENATRICEANFGVLSLSEGDAFRVVGMHNAPLAFAELRRHEPTFRPSGHIGVLMAQAIATMRAVQVADVAALDDPLSRTFSAATEARSIIIVPMLKENETIGAFMVYRKEVRPFNDKQTELLTNFAAQAVIAIENARLLTELRQRTDDLSESLEQQTATSEVLRVISSSPGDLQPVFAAMLENAVRISGAKFGIIHSWDGESLRLLATHNLPPALNEARRRAPQFRPGPKTGIRRMAATKSVIHIPDLAEDDGYLEERAPQVVAAVEQGGVRTMLAVPMLKENEVVGAFTVYRQEVRPFNDKQIALITSFASQAVIAIENARLLSELRESLAQQTATSDVLSVISSSPGELQLVFQSMLENATRLCGANFGILSLCEGDAFRVGAMHNMPPVFMERFQREPIIRAGPLAPISRVAASKDFVHIVDLTQDAAYKQGDPPVVSLVEIGGVRGILVVPMLKEGELIGALSIYRNEIRPFTDKQIDLVKNFAAQAVIAIENTRLLTELRQRTNDLTESLEQQTATSEVLQVISSSPGDLQPVFATMLEKAIRICDANFGNIYRWDGMHLHRVAAHNTPPALAEARRHSPLRPDPDAPLGCAMATKSVVHSADLAAEEAYLERRSPGTVAGVELGGIRTFLAVPVLKENELIGVFSLFRQEVRPFTDKQIALVTSFAAQAVIAIENARLLTELRQRTDELGRSVGELRALGEVSQAVNSTLDLETVLSTIVAKAVQLSNTEAGAIYVFDDARREFHLRATYGMERDLIDALKKRYIGLDETNIAMAIGQHEPIQVADLREETSNAINEIILRAGFRARLTAPLMRGEDIVGMLVVRRRMPGAFPQNTVDLIKTFAAQSVLAIQNARLFENVETRTGELARSLKDLQTAQDRLVQTEKLASLGQLTAGIAHEIKNPLNFVNNFSAVSVELIDELREALGGVRLDSKLRAEIDEIADMLQGNLDKVVQHGKRADSIVKNMLLHSRAGSGEHRPVDINAIVEESLNLAYHGARAEKQGFNIALERSFDPAAGEIDLFPQEMTRVLLNLISNGFYAATKRKTEANGGNYEPTLTATTKNLGDSVEIRIRDNGTGIPPEVKDKMFNPFFTTKPAGEGTGLGLSLSHDIIVKQHSGSIEVDTKPGEFTEFRIVLPRGAATIAKLPNSTSGEHT